MRKPKYSLETKVKTCKEYLSGKKSALQIAREIGTGKHGDEMIRKWTKVFKMHGPKGLKNRINNSCYTKEFKKQVVSMYLSGKFPIMELAVKYNIPSGSTICS